MATSLEAPLTRVQSLELHRRLVEGDPTASSDLAVAYLDWLIAWLGKRNSRRIRPDLIGEAAEDALIALSKHPQSFDPNQRKDLSAYLKMSAQRDLQNSLRGDRRFRRQNTSLELVALSPDAGKYLGRDADPSKPLQTHEDLSLAQQVVLPAVRKGLTDGELKALDLLLEGKRKTAAFAQALGIQNLSRAEQERQVKRLKDKLKHRIKRARIEHGESP